MNINELLKEKNMTTYRLSKIAGIPYATLSDICLGKAGLARCSAETVYRIAKALDVSMEQLLDPILGSRPDFALFKSNACHRLKQLGDIAFICESLKRDDVTQFYDRQWYPECLYTLALIDYLSRIHEIPTCEDYNKYRSMKLTEPLFSSGVMSMYSVTGDETVKQDAIANAIPEFIRYNIVESEIRDVN